MQLQDMTDYKDRLMRDLLSNEEIVRLLDPDRPEDDTDGLYLAYSQVFPFEYVPETAEYGKTYICFDVDVQKSLNKTFLLPTLYIWVFTHKSKLRLKEGGVRTDRLCAEIASTINGSHYYGLGELDLFAVKRFAPATDFNGKVMTFDLVERNRRNPNTKEVPSNRKQW